MALALIVDDSKPTRMLLSRTLQQLGYAVTEAANGQDALRELSRSEQIPQLILTDWNMPEMDGLQFVQELRKVPRFAVSTVLMITTRNEMGQIVEALQAGVNEYIMKPFTMEILEDKLRMLKLI